MDLQEFQQLSYYQFGINIFHRNWCGMLPAEVVKISNIIDVFRPHWGNSVQNINVVFRLFRIRSNCLGTKLHTSGNWILANGFFFLVWNIQISKSNKLISSEMFQIKKKRSILVMIQLSDNSMWMTENLYQRMIYRIFYLCLFNTTWLRTNGACPFWLSVVIVLK